MSNTNTCDVYRFVVVYRREPSESSGKVREGRGHVTCVPKANSQSPQEIRFAFTDLDQLPKIIRQYVDNAGRE